MTVFYIYENRVRRRRVIHLAECSYCNQGKGQHRDFSGINGQWHGPMSRNDVILFKDGATACTVCMPSLQINDGPATG